MITKRAKPMAPTRITPWYFNSRSAMVLLYLFSAELCTQSTSNPASIGGEQDLGRQKTTFTVPWSSGDSTYQTNSRAAVPSRLRFMNIPSPRLKDSVPMVTLDQYEVLIPQPSRLVTLT